MPAARLVCEHPSDSSRSCEGIPGASAFPVMRSTDVVTSALGQIHANKLRSFFTLLGIIVSVAFLVAVIAIIQGMNAYVRENIAGAVVGANSFQVRRTPINIAPVSDNEMDRIRRRPRITQRDAQAVAAALPEARAISIQSG